MMLGEEEERREDGLQEEGKRCSGWKVCLPKIGALRAYPHTAGGKAEPADRFLHPLLCLELELLVAFKALSSAPYLPLHFQLLLAPLIHH